MAVRAVWRGVIRFADVGVPVKLYAAVEDRGLHFRLLHRKDRSPVRQAMVNPRTGDVVPYADTRRAWITEDGWEVLLDREELAALDPPASRDIEILAFAPPAAIDRRWYERPYYLGPGGDPAQYAALAEGLAAERREGLARWTMRGKSYVGALTLHGGYLMLISLRHAGEVIATTDLELPRGPALDKKELAMARELIGMLEADFEPADYVDEHHERVLALIEAKARGRKMKLPRRRRRKGGSEDLSGALGARLAALRRRA